MRLPVCSRIAHLRFKPFSFLTAVEPIFVLFLNQRFITRVSWHCMEQVPARTYRRCTHTTRSALCAHALTCTQGTFCTLLPARTAYRWFLYALNHS